MEFVMEGIPCGAAHADVGSEADEHDGLNAPLPQQGRQLRADEAAVSLLDDGQVAPLRLESWVEGDERGFWGKSRPEIWVLVLPDLGPAVLGDDVTDENAQDPRIESRVEEPPEAR